MGSDDLEGEGQGHPGQLSILYAKYTDLHWESSRVRPVTLGSISMSSESKWHKCTKKVRDSRGKWRKRRREPSGDGDTDSAHSRVKEFKVSTPL